MRVTTRPGSLQGIYPGLQACHSGTTIQLNEVRVHLVGQGGENLIPCISTSYVELKNPSESLSDGDLLVEGESKVLLQVRRLRYADKVGVRLLEPHPQRVQHSERVIDELATHLSPPLFPKPQLLPSEAQLIER